MKIPFSLKVIISLVICELAGIIGSIFTTPAIGEWYSNLIRPTFAPPNWIFAPVWTILFALMGLALALVWDKGLERKEVRLAVELFSVQLALNILWSVIFFGLHSLIGSLIEILVLLLFILITTKSFSKVSRPAAYLMLPYILWVSFAVCLNYAFWVLN